VPETKSARIGGLGAADLLEQVLETMPSGMYTVDARGRVTSWNRTMEKLTGFTAAEILGEPCTRLRWSTCQGVDASTPGRACDPCPLFHQGSVEGRRCQLKRANGRPLLVLKNARVMRDKQGEIVGGIEVVTDLTGVAELEQKISSLRQQATGRSVHDGIVGRHPVMRALRERIELAARSDSSVLVLGETGTGKELVAKAVHDLSSRASGPFVQVSCAALNESLLESELFGHVRGAFTGALAARVGRFEAASRGTIFLDEIGDVPMHTQTRLLRVLQERQIERVGTNDSLPIDIRIIAATNRDLIALCEAGKFRWDLYYRLCVIPLHVPPLRDRRSDLPLLVDYFLDRLNRHLDREIGGIEPDAMRTLMAWDWPGNVRELENAIEYAAVLGRDRTLQLGDLPGHVLEPRRRRHPTPPPTAVSAPSRAPGVIPEREELLDALRSAGGNRRIAASRLGVSRVTLWKWLKARKISFPTSRQRH